MLFERRTFRFFDRSLTAYYGPHLGRYTNVSSILDPVHDYHLHGPYSATTLSMNSASTEYMIKSDALDTKWPSLSTETPGRSIL